MKKQKTKNDLNTRTFKYNIIIIMFDINSNVFYDFVDTFCFELVWAVLITS